MATPRSACAGRTPNPVRHGFAARRAPANFDSSKRGAARHRTAGDIAHRQIRFAPRASIVTGFETAHALQPCKQSAGDGDGLRDTFTDPTVHSDNKPAPQAAKCSNKRRNK